MPLGTSESNVSPRSGDQGTSRAASASQVSFENNLVSSKSNANEPVSTTSGARSESGGERTSRQRWRNSIRRVSQQSSVLSLFKTLRDMHPDVRIEPEWIAPVRQAKAKSVLGEGAFAVVEKCLYKPPNVATGRLVAVKRLKPELLTDDLEITLFVKEADLLRKLKHRHIVEYVGVGGSSTEPLRSSSSSEVRDLAAAERPTPQGTASSVMPGAVFLVQELMDGGSLKRKIWSAMMGKATYRYTDALRWATHIAKGLRYLHEAQPVVLHRDLKCDNVLLTSRDETVAEAKICDFGLSALLPTRRQQGIPDKSFARSDERPALEPQQSSEELQAEWSAAMQKVGSVGMAAMPSFRESHRANSSWGDSSVRLGGAEMLHLSGKTGSLMYMAPEMYKCEAYNSGVDVFSFGVVLFELFSRAMVIYLVCKQGLHEETELYAKHVSSGYRPPLTAPVFHNDLGLLIADCWAHESSRRPSMAKVVERLGEIEATGVLQAMDVKRCGCSVS